MVPATSEIASPAWSQLWQVTALAAAVGALTWLCCRRRPHLAYVFWMLVVVKCLTPPVWSSPTGVFSWARARTSPANAHVPSPPSEVELAAAAAAPTPPERIDPPAPKASLFAAAAEIASAEQPDGSGARPSVSWAGVLAGVWMAGVVLLGAVVACKWVVLHRLVRRASISADGKWAAMAAALARRLGLRCRVRVLVTSDPIGPAVFGLFRPVVILPERLLRERTNEQIEPVLAHELVHVRRRDTLAGLLQTLAQVVWWFHPLVWWANREACRQRERCCDEEVIAGLGCRPAAYARSLLDVLELQRDLRPVLGFPGLRPVEVTRRRLEDIVKHASSFHRRTPAWCWLVLAAGLLLVVPGAGLRVAESGTGGSDNSAVQAAAEKEKPEPKRPAVLRFEPVVERTVFDDVPGSEFLIDLDTGKVFAPPEDFKPEDLKEATKWFAEHGVDAMGEGDMLLGIDMVALPTAQSNWDPQPRIFAQIEAGKPGTPIPITGHGKLPATYFFKTREGSRGVLQIVAFEPTTDDDPQKTKIRYKLLTASKSTSKENPDSELLEAQVQAARSAYQQAVRLYEISRAEPEDVYRWSKRWLEVQLQAKQKGQDRLAAGKAHLERMRRLDDQAQAKLKAGAETPERFATTHYRLEAERRLKELQVVAGMQQAARARDWAMLSPFTQVEVLGDGTVKVHYEGREYELLAIDDLETRNILESSRQQFGNLWEKRFVEDLVEVLEGMGHRPGKAVKLVLRDPQTAETRTVDRAPLTRENRQKIYRARYRNRTR